jgi:type II secretory pathway pseudopilin PulG
MSNVLIGIIGVILFIGLALAGALFLGPRFQESTNNSKASAAVQAVSQVSSAVNMYQVQEGKAPTNSAITGPTTPTASYTELVTGQYLKSVPTNPAGTGAISISDGPTATSKRVTMPLSTNAQAICEAIHKQTGGTGTTVPTAATIAAIGNSATGCANVAGTYTAYANS